MFIKKAAIPGAMASLVFYGLLGCQDADEVFLRRSDMHSRSAPYALLLLRDTQYPQQAPRCWLFNLESLTTTTVSGSLAKDELRCLRFEAGEANKDKPYEYKLTTHSGDADLFVSWPDCDPNIRPNQRSADRYCVWRAQSLNTSTMLETITAEPGTFVVLGVRAFRAGNYTLEITQL